MYYCFKTNNILPESYCNRFWDDNLVDTYDSKMKNCCIKVPKKIEDDLLFSDLVDREKLYKIRSAPTHEDAMAV